MRSLSSEVLVAVALSLSVLAGCTPTSADASPRRAPAVMAAAAPSATPAAPSPARPAPSSRYPLPSPDELRARLSPLAYEVTQNAATEAPFQNAYWNNHAAGIYVDVATGEPLFSSADKFESGTGWPSFTKPIEDGHVVEHTDATHGMIRREVVSASGGSHLGHVFDDGPPPTRQRFCINSASLRFVPVGRLAAESYGAYAAAFGVAGASEAPAPATSNSCTLPPPGEKPGCSATLDVAIFARAEGDDRVARPAGILDVVSGREGDAPAIEVTFDPEKTTFAQVVAAWTKGRAKGAVVYARSDAQRKVAAERALRVAEAVPFARE